MQKLLAVQFLFFIPLQLSDVTKVFSFLAITPDSSNGSFSNFQIPLNENCREKIRKQRK